MSLSNVMLDRLLNFYTGCKPPLNRASANKHKMQHRNPNLAHNCVVHTQNLSDNYCIVCPSAD